MGKGMHLKGGSEHIGSDASLTVSERECWSRAHSAIKCPPTQTPAERRAGPPSCHVSLLYEPEGPL